MRQSQQLTLGVGIGLGLALPYVVQFITRLFPRKDTDGSKKGDTTHAVRSGLNDKSAIRLPQSTLEEFIAKILCAAGVNSPNANLVAKVLAYADARGIPSHGSNRADTYINEIMSGVVHGTAEPVIEKQTGCCAVVNGSNGLGAVTSHLAMTTAISLAKEHGVGLVVCRMSNHFGAAGFWSKMALDAGMVGMSFTNTSAMAVPTGGKTRAVGTNPFCFFAPASVDNTPDSFQLDMATTVVPIGKIEVMNRIGKPVPPGWGVDRDGNVCTDSEEICKNGGLFPLGGAEETAGYKGYGLGCFIEIMSAILSGSDFGPTVKPWIASRDGAIDYGHCFIVIDPKRFTAGFETRCGKYIKTMRSQPGNVLVAGDPEKEFELDAEKNGIILHKEVAASLKCLSERYSIVPPAVFDTIDTTETKESLYAS